MTEIIKEWWGVIIAFLGGAVWVGKLQQDVSHLKAGGAVAKRECQQLREGIKELNKVQFDNGEKQFTEIKELISHNDEASQARHSEVMRILLEMNK